MIKDGARDYIDELLYTSEFAGSIDDIPTAISLWDGVIQDQDEAGYPYGCVHFATSMNDNYANSVDGITFRSKGGWLADSSETFDPNIGDFIIAGPKTAKKHGLIKGYFQCKTLDDVLQAIANGYRVHTGTNKFNWTLTKQKGIAQLGSGYGHSFQLVGYNNHSYNTFIQNGITILPKTILACNSYNNFKYFLIPFDYFNKLFFTKVYFVNNLEPILQYKKKIMDNIKIESAKRALENKIWNGERPQDQATREEVRAMIERMYERIIGKD